MGACMGMWGKVTSDTQKIKFVFSAQSHIPTNLFLEVWKNRVPVTILKYFHLPDKKFFFQKFDIIWLKFNSIHIVIVYKTHVFGEGGGGINIPHFPNVHAHIWIGAVIDKNHNWQLCRINTMCTSDTYQHVKYMYIWGHQLTTWSNFWEFFDPLPGPF